MEAYYIAALEQDLNQDKGRYSLSIRRSSGQVIAGYPVDHMINFPLVIDSEEVFADAERKFKKVQLFVERYV